MSNLTPTCINISDWQIDIHMNTSGTRRKKIALDSSDNMYFFKGSKESPDGDVRYPTEFWSEIVSSKIGQFFGFNMLDYNIGYRSDDKQKFGCLSKSMVESTMSELIEGKSYLVAFDPNYNPSNDKKKYTFQFIQQALIKSKLDNCIEDLIEVIIFDALISNSDRHQENWGVIIHHTEIDTKSDNVYSNKKSDNYWINLFRKSTKQSDEQTSTPMSKRTFAPIYDSGCCLGREKDDCSVKQLLKDKKQFDAYINKGSSEIHWENHNKKQKHFELVKLVRKEYSNKVNKVLNRIKEKFNKESIRDIINNIDSNLPNQEEFNEYKLTQEEFDKYKLTNDRKELMIKIILSRFDRLMKLK